MNFPGDGHILMPPWLLLSAIAVILLSAIVDIVELIWTSRQRRRVKEGE